MPAATRPTSPVILSALVVCCTLTAPAAHEAAHDQITRITRQIASSPDEASLYLRRAALHREEGAWLSARSDYETSLRLDPGLDLAWLGLGAMLLEADQPSEAETPLRTFLTFRPQSAEGAALLGRALARAGSFAEAARLLTRSILWGSAAGLRPAPDVYLDRARCHVALDDIDGALEGLAEGNHLLGNPITLELESLAIETDYGRTDGALERLDRLASRTQRPERWLVRKGSLLEEVGRTDDAVQAWQQAGEAIRRLPASRRASRSVLEMEQTIVAALARLGSSCPEGEGR